MGRVLAIDDEQIMRDLIVDAIEIGGHEIVAVASAREGLALAEKGSFELVIADIVMHDNDGFSVIKRLHEIQPDLQFLVVTGTDQNMREKYLESAGIDQMYELLEKPFRITDLIEVVNRLIGPPTERPADG